VADFPNVLSAIYTLEKEGLIHVDIALQVSRFYHTYNKLVNHTENQACNNTIGLTMFRGKVTCINSARSNLARTNNSCHYVCRDDGLLSDKTVCVMRHLLDLL